MPPAQDIWRFLLNEVGLGRYLPLFSESTRIIARIISDKSAMPVCNRREQDFTDELIDRAACPVHVRSPFFPVIFITAIENDWFTQY